MKLFALVLLFMVSVLLVGTLADVSSPLVDARRMNARLLVLTVIAITLLLAMSL